MLPAPKTFGWTNVVYQMHAYEYDWNNLEKQRHNSESGMATQTLLVPGWISAPLEWAAP